MNAISAVITREKGRLAPPEEQRVIEGEIIPADREPPPPPSSARQACQQAAQQKHNFWMSKSLDDIRRHAAQSECCCGGIGFVRYPVPYGHPAFGVAIPCSCRASGGAQIKLEKLFTDAKIPARYDKLSFDTFRSLPLDGKRAALELALQFADVDNYYRERGLVVRGLHREGLLLCGPVGRGKSGLSAAVARAWLEGGRSVLWITWGDFMRTVRGTFNNPRAETNEAELVDAAKNVALLVLDELGDINRGHGQMTLGDQFGVRVNHDFELTPWQRAITLALVGYRHRERLPIFMTTNLNADEIRVQLGAQIDDRIDESCHLVEVGGVNIRDWRKEQDALP